MDKREKKGLAIGALLGAVVGVITGILFAPKSGKETRKDIKDAAGKAADTLVQEAHKLQDDAKELIEKTESKIKQLKGKAGDVAKDHVKEIKHTTENVRTAVRAFKDGKASDKDLNDAIKQAKAAHSALKTYLKK